MGYIKANFILHTTRVQVVLPLLLSLPLSKFVPRMAIIVAPLYNLRSMLGILAC
jgi:hypothetical protein